MLSILLRNILWIAIIIYLFWHVFVSAIVLNPMGLIPIGFAVVSAILLRARHSLLPFTLQAWAVYIFVSSGLKLVGMMMQSAGSITYEWSMFGLFRACIFLVFGVFLCYVSRMVDDLFKFS